MKLKTIFDTSLLCLSLGCFAKAFHLIWQYSEEPKCSLYPSDDEETCICGAGSDVSGSKFCTKEDENNCQWAKERKRRNK